MRVKIKVHNIKCNGCANSIKRKLEEITGVNDVLVAVEEGEVEFDAQESSDSLKAKELLEHMGYSEDDPNILQTAKSYVSCMIGRVK